MAQGHISLSDPTEGNHLGMPEDGLAHRTLSGAPPDSSVCQTEQRFGCTEPSLLVLFFSLFLALRQHLLVLQNNVLSLETYLVM